MRVRLLGFALAAMSVAAFTIGCNDNEVKCTNADNGDCTAIGTTCGAGTKLADGKCVLDTTGCGAGTRQDDATGTCVADPTTICGDGTQYDTTKQTCVTTGEVECGDGTTLTDGVCVADTTPPVNPTCGTGTVLVGNQCVPSSPTTCGAGTVLVGGECVPAVTCTDNQIQVGNTCVAAAFVQLVHNYSAIASADVYVDGNKVASAVAFQSASAFIGVDATVDHTVQVVAAGSAAPTDALTTLTLAQGDVVAVVITDSTTTGPVAVTVAAARTPGTGTSAFAFADVSPDLTSAIFSVGLYDVLSGGPTFTPTSLAFGQSTAHPVTLPGRTLAFELGNGSRTSVVGQFQTSSGSALPVITNVTNTSGVAALILVSGHVAGADFGVFAVPAAGGAFERLDSAARVQVIRGSGVPAVADLFINGALAGDAMTNASATTFLPVVAGAPVAIAYTDDTVNQLGAAPVGTQLVSQSYTFAVGQPSVVVQYGNQGQTTGMQLGMLGFPVHFAGSSATTVDTASFDGIVGSSTMSVVADGYAAVNFAYGTSRDYTAIGAVVETFTVDIDFGSEFVFDLDLTAEPNGAGVLVIAGTAGDVSLFFVDVAGNVLVGTPDA